jgi:hypothetical protein
MFGSLLLFGTLLVGQVEGLEKVESTVTRPTDAKAKTDPKLAGRVRRLVQQLDSPQLRQRNQAEEELISIGSAVLDLLPKEPDPSRPERDERLGRIRLKLERSGAKATLEPSLVTLEGELPVSKILAAIQEQTGNKIVDGRREAGAEADPLLKVRFSKTPFWQALDRVLDDAGLTLYPYAEEKSIRVMPQSRPVPPRSKRASYSGPFRFEPIDVLSQRNLRNPAGDSLKIRVEVSWEPRIAPINLQLKMSDIQAFDGEGQPLKLEERGANLEVPVEPEVMAKEIVLPLDLPPRSVKQIGRLAGTLTALTPGKIETFRFADLEKAKKVEKRVAGVTVTLEEVRKNNKLWEVRTLVHFDETSGALASHRTWVFNNPATLEGADGKPVSYDTSETYRQTPNELGMAYLFFLEKPLADYKFVYKTPAMIFASPFAFEFRGIELP